MNAQASETLSSVQVQLLVASNAHHLPRLTFAVLAGNDGCVVADLVEVGRVAGVGEPHMAVFLDRECLRAIRAGHHDAAAESHEGVERSAVDGCADGSPTGAVLAEVLPD